MTTSSPTPSIVDSFRKGIHTLRRVYNLSVFPLILDLVFLTSRFVQSMRLYSFRFGVGFSLPFYLPTLTDVYNFPTMTGNSVLLTGIDIFPILGLGVILYAIVHAYLSAGYLGRLHSSIAEITNPPSFFSSAGKYFVRILILGLLWLGLGLFSIILLAGSPLLFLVYFGILLILGYFLFLAPFIIVANNATFSEAIGTSIGIAKSSRTLGYSILYAFATVPISILVYLILNIGLLGFILAVVGFSFVGTGLVASTFHFIAQPTNLVGPAPTMNIGTDPNRDK